MKRNIPYLMLIVVVSSACSAWITDPKTGTDFLPDRFGTEDELALYVNGLYDRYQSDQLFGRDLIVLMDIRSDDLKLNNNAVFATSFHNFQVSPEDPILRNIWRGLYQVIQQCNAVLERSVQVIDQQDYVDHLFGEVHAMRAISYFYLVNLFAQLPQYTADASHSGIPLLLTFNEDINQPRAPVQAVYDQIHTDLIQAELLMQNWERTDFLSAQAAAAMQVRVYRFQHDWIPVLDIANKLIDNHFTGLIDKLNVNDYWQNGVVPDALFEIINSVNDPPGINNLNRIYTNLGTGEYLPAQDLVDLYDSTIDVRNEWFRADLGLDSAFGQYRLIKYPNPNGKDNIPILRWSEVLLNRAEANAQLGNLTEAIEDLQIIRQRATGRTITIEANREFLIQMIWEERRKELAFEGLRFWDLILTERGILRNDCTGNICSISYPSDFLVLPIPQSEIELNPNLIQNPGY